MQTDTTSKQTELTINNQVSEMQKVEEWLSLLSESHGYQPRTSFALDLVLNEALINIISYGHDDDLAHQIHINLEDSPSEVNVEITDDGHAFNPLEADIQLPSSDLEKTSIGGRGILLMKQYCSKLSYCYSEGKNRLFFTIGKSEHKTQNTRRKSKNNIASPLHLANGKTFKQESRSKQQRHQHDFISNQGFFDNVSYRTIEPLIELCDIFQMKPGDILLEPQQPNNNLYLLLEGQLKVHIDKLDSEEGFLVKPGEFLGELSVIDGQLPSAYVVTEENSQVLAIPSEILWNNFFTKPLIARNFMRMFAQRLRDRNKHIQRALEQELRLLHLQKELSIARNIQASMLPSEKSLRKRFPQVDVETSMIPANEVGGDFFDAFPLDDERICLSIGDVSGKGIPASLFMVKTLTLLREEVLHQHNLVSAVKNLNEKLCQDNDSCMFTTLIVGILNTRNGQFSYINAGHNLPLFGPGGQNFEYIESPKGILVGINEMAEHSVTELTLKPDDVLVLYTDGVTEAMNNEGEFFSDARFQKLLSKKDTRNAHNIVQKINASVKEFADGAPQSDDLTLVALRYC